MSKPNKKDCKDYCENYELCQSKNWDCKRAVIFNGKKSYMGTVAQVERLNGKMKFRLWKESREVNVNGFYF